MHYLGHYLYEYIKIGKFTLWMALAIAFLFAIRFFKKKFQFKLKSRTVFIIICAVGLLLRLGWLSYSGHEPKSAWAQGAGGLNGGIMENDIINIHAAEIREGKWFLDENGAPSARRPIGYPIALGFLYKAFGVHAPVAWAFHLILYLLTLWIIYKMALLMFDEQIGLISAFLFAINPISIYSIKLITDEHLFLMLWYGGLLLLFYDIHRGKLKAGWVWYGIIFGVAAMTRTYAIFMPVIVGVAYWAKNHNWKKAIASFLLVLVMMQIVNLPWLMRNYKAFGVPVVYAIASHSLYYSTNPSATPESDGHPSIGQPGYSSDFAAAVAVGDQGLAQKYANQAIVRWIVNSPLVFFDLGTSKVLYFMHWGKRKGVWPLFYQFLDGHYDAARKIPEKIMKSLKEYAFFFYYLVFHFFIFASIYIGFYGRRRIPRENRICIGIVWACMACWLLMHMIIMPDPKYRLPLEPLMAIFASYLIAVITQNKKKEQPASERSFSAKLSGQVKHENH